MTAPCADYRIITEDDAECQRIIAVDQSDIQIVGAYRPQSLNDWRIYLSKAFSDAVGMPQPHKVHAVSRLDAVRWIDVLASFYMKAVSQ